METFELAKQIVQKLTRAGHIAYFAGGWVRDYLMGHPSYDIDIATDAPPEKILDLFPNTISVGIAFGVVIVPWHGKQFEIATFRKDVGYENGRTPLRIESATPQEDAQRRDFTINGMFYDPLEDVIYDYVHGAEDIKHQVIRTIGNPNERFIEDRLRMIRAIRFSARFNFHIDLETQEAIQENADTLFPAVSMERVWQEFNRMAQKPRFDYAVIEMHRLGLLSTVFPELAHVHLHDIKKMVASFDHFPQGSPTIAYLMEIFPNKNLKEIEDLCRYLKASNADIKFAAVLLQARELVKQEEEGLTPEPYTWSHFYAHPHALLSMEILAARYLDEKKHAFLHANRERYQALLTHIHRIRDKRPVVNAALLQENGIPPGKLMGPLLKEAERLSINRHLENPEIILSLIKESSLWPKP